MIMTASPEMVMRRDCAQATYDQFNGKEHRWGSVDCGRIVAWHLRQFAHQPRLHRFGAYRTARGAAAALKRAGFRTLPDALDDLGLFRITPAEARVADIVAGEGADPFGAIGIYLGNDALLGFREDVPIATALRRVTLSAAWSVI